MNLLGLKPNQNNSLMNGKQPSDTQLSLLATVCVTRHYPQNGLSSWCYFPSRFSYRVSEYGSELGKKKTNLWFALKKTAWSASVLSQLKTFVRRHKCSFSLLAFLSIRVYYLADDWEKWAPVTIQPQLEEGFYIYYLKYPKMEGSGNEMVTFSSCLLRSQLQE